MINRGLIPESSAAPQHAPPEYIMATQQPDPRAYAASDFDGTGTSLLELAVGFFKYRRRVLLAMLATFLVGVGVTALTPSEYPAHASVLATFGPEYTARPDAGANGIGGQSFQQDEIVRTERDILGNDALHRAVIKQVGVGTLYPDLVKTGGFGMADVLLAIKGVPATVAHWFGARLPAKPAPHDPVERALADFDAHFSTSADAKSSTIGLTFVARSPELAARVLNVLVATYLDMRRTLYSSPQSAIVAGEVTQLRHQLDDANQRLNAYKTENQIGDFKSRREILLKAQGAAEEQLAKATGLIDQNKARIDSLTAQLTHIPATIVAQRDMAADIHTEAPRRSVDALRQSLAQLEATYNPNSPVVQRMRRQLNAREADLSKLQHDGQASTIRYAENPLWTTANTALLNATNDLKAATAYVSQLHQYLDKIALQLRDVNALDERLTTLDEQRKIAADSYAAGVKELEQRKLVDMVDARKQTSVRILEPAVPPIRSTGTHRMQLIVTLIASLLVGAGVALLSNYFRDYYLTTRELERELGLPVLASVSHQSLAALPKLNP